MITEEIRADGTMSTLCGIVFTFYELPVVSNCIICIVHFETAY